MLNKVMNFLRDEEGASAVEYALIAGLIAVVLVAAITVLNGGFTTVFGNIANKLTTSST
ncbi:Flp family type IVb pilin [Solimonas terrae]|uniref:Flp family type IVb pilin n=1 Tax=Solimonas terrae TaxID=1396819 RepID=A0A6M2BRL5_9GAMM|nr:Flp family type IVb pilin [Solimonas terrae]NGY05282.1 Flp family type IVb pilin [Solimonas terrae]